MNAEHAPMAWRVRTGSGLFVASIAWPVLIPVLPLLGVSAAATAAFGGVMLVAAEVLMLAGAAIAGKEGFALIKSRVLGLLGMDGPIREVGRLRYTIGLVLFTSALRSGGLRRTSATICPLTTPARGGTPLPSTRCC